MAGEESVNPGAPATEPVSTPITESPGERMRRAREQRQLSPKEVADELRLTETHLRYLEENQFDKLAGDTFVRGYLRGFARVVDLDADPLLALYERYTGQDQPQESEQEQADAASKRSVPPVVWVVIGILVVIALLAVFTSEQPEPPAPPVVNPPATDTAPQDSPLGDNPDAVEPVADGAVEVTEPQAAEPAVTAEPAATATPESPAAAELAQLVLVFDGECWVEITDSEDSLLAAELYQPGEELTVSGVPPLTVLLGDAREVRVRFNGEPVAVAPHPTNHSARLVLGEQP